MPARVFFDTGPLLAAVIDQDPDHARARNLLERLSDGEWAAAHTSDYVLAEAFNYIRRKTKNPAPADALHRLVWGTADIEPLLASVVRIHGGRFAQALEHYRARFELGLSLTDWTSVVAMRDAGLAQIATFDAGFHAVVPTVVA